MCTAQRLMQNARSHSSVFIRSIQVCQCDFALHQEQKRDHFGTVAIDVHSMFHYDSAAEKPEHQAWAGPPLACHIYRECTGTCVQTQELAHEHKNLRTNPVDPSSPLQKLTHSVTLIVSCILNSTNVWFCPPQCGLCSFRAQNKAELLSPVDPGISRGVTDLYPSRGYTHPVTRAIEVSHAACKAEF